LQHLFDLELKDVEQALDDTVPLPEKLKRCQLAVTDAEDRARLNATAMLYAEAILANAQN